VKKKSDLQRGGPLLSRQALLRGGAAGLATASMAPLLGMFAGSSRSAELQRSSGLTGQANEPLIVADASIACSIRKALREVNLLVVTSNGRLFYNHRIADGSVGVFGPWHSYVDVTAEAGHAGEIVGADMAWNVDGLQLIAATRDGGVWHTGLNKKTEKWSPFGDVKHATGTNPGHAVDVTGVDVPINDVHFGVVTSDGGLFHAIRRSDGAWTPFGSVRHAASNPGHITDADFGTGGFDLQVVALTSDGISWHTLRHGNGSWTPFGDIKHQVGNPGGTVVDVTCAGFPFELHVGAVTAPHDNIVPGDLLHTKRFFGGGWQRGWNDVDVLAGDPGEIVAADFAFDDERYLHVTAVAKDGAVWYAFRFPPPPDEKWLAFRKVMPGDR
jgi:hypothetical protein